MFKFECIHPGESLVGASYVHAMYKGYHVLSSPLPNFGVELGMDLHLEGCVL